jgi:hypothetical protein
MVASRNQQHVMHRAFGSTPNGSLPAYGAVGELNNYLGNMPSVSMRGLGATPKPDMKPTLKGEIIDSVEFGSKFGWCAIYIIARNKKASGGGTGYTTEYAVQYICPSNKIARTVGEYPTLAAAQLVLIQQQESLRNTGVTASGISGLGAWSMSPDSMVSSGYVAPLAIGAMWIGAGLPGARTALDLFKRFIDEPAEAIQTGLLTVGFIGFSFIVLSKPNQVPVPVTPAEAGAAVTAAGGTPAEAGAAAAAAVTAAGGTPAEAGAAAEAAVAVAVVP